MQEGRAFSMGTDFIRLSREYLKSYYSINSFIGCAVNCAYCFLAPIQIVPMHPIMVIEEKELIKSMMADPLFRANETVLSLNNRTDPFISENVKASTFRLLDIMEQQGLHNIVTITSKGLLNEEDAKKLDTYRNLRIVIIVTYNGLPLNIQPVCASIQEQTMRNVSKCKNVRVLHQFRPIIPGINDSEAVIRKVLGFARNYCYATIYQGIRVNPFIAQRLQERAYIYKGVFDEHKQKSLQTDQIFETLTVEYPSYQIFDHTSCCLSFLFSKPDYNMHFSKNVCRISCGNYSRCHSKHATPQWTEKGIGEALQEIGVFSPWRIEQKVLHIDGALNDEQKSFIKHILHIQVRAKSRENTYSEKMIEK